MDGHYSNRNVESNKSKALDMALKIEYDSGIILKREKKRSKNINIESPHFLPDV